MRPFRDRLVFDAENGQYLDGGIRYMMIRPDALMGILHELDEAQRMPVLEAFARSITRHGGKSAAAYQAMGAADAEALVRTIEATAPELGWGRWHLARTPAGFDLSVENSPFVHGHGPHHEPLCHPIVGMLRAVGRMALGGEVEVAEVACAAAGGVPACRFEVRRTAREAE